MFPVDFANNFDIFRNSLWQVLSLIIENILVLKCKSYKICVYQTEARKENKAKHFTYGLTYVGPDPILPTLIFKDRTTTFVQS